MNTSSPTPAPTSGTPVWKASPGGDAVYINSVAVSGDGNTVFAGTFFSSYGAMDSRRGPYKHGLGGTEATFGTYCYDQNGTLKWKDEFQAVAGVYWAALSENGATAAAGGLMTDTQEAQTGFVRIYSGFNGRFLLNYPTAGRVNQVAVSADGGWVVAGADTLILFTFDGSTGRFVKVDEYVPPTSVGGDSNGVVSVQISAAGDTIVFSDYDGHVGVLSNTKGHLALRALWKTPSSFCHMLSLSPDGQYFAGGGAAGVFYQFVTERFVASGVPTYSYATGVSGPVYGVACASNGSVFAGVVNNGADAGNVDAIAIIDQAPSPLFSAALLRNPNCVALNLHGGLMAVATGHPDGTPGYFYLFDGVLNSGLPIVAPALRWQFQTGNMSWPIALSSDGTAVVGGSDDSYVYYFRP